MRLPQVESDSFVLEHDPEKREPVFRKEHAQTRKWTTSMIQLS
jgi:hypothetical protein